MLQISTHTFTKIQAASSFASLSEALRQLPMNLWISERQWLQKMTCAHWKEGWTKSLPRSSAASTRSYKCSSTNTQAGLRSWRGRSSSSPFRTIRAIAKPGFAFFSKLTSALLVCTLVVFALLLFPGIAAAAFPVVEATNTSSEASAVSSHSVALPASIAAGDELLVIFGALNTTFNLPTGWTQLYNSGSVDPGLFIIRRTASGGEGATLTVTTGSSVISNHESYRLSGAGAIEASTAATGNSSSPDPPSLTPSGGALDYLWLAVEVHSDNKTVNAYPTNYTNGFQVVGSEASVASARRELNASSEDPGVFTLSGAKQWRAVTLAVPPPPDAPTALVTTSNTGSVELSWTAPADDGGSNLETYGVWRNTSVFTTTSDATLLASIATTSTTYSDTSAVHGTIYYYSVTATNQTATSSLSNQRVSSSNSGRIIRLGGLLGT